MLRKLIVMAVTATVAKKAYNMYTAKTGSSGVTDVTPRKSASSGPLAGSGFGQSSRPSAS